MKNLLLSILLLCLAATTAHAQWWVHPNEIGLYTVEEPNGSEDCYLYTTGPGLYTVHLVITSPRNDNTGDPITTIGGFELSLDMGGDWQINDADLPPNVLDFNNHPEHFYCSGFIPVTGDFTTLATITLLTFDPQSTWIFISPYSVGAPSIPNCMAITDANDGFSLSRAFPISGDYAHPVFGINMMVIPTESKTWGDLKALYR